MTATNHAAAGAIIGLAIDKPLLAIPLALLSHFAMDALPHFGYPGHGGFGPALKHHFTYFYLYLDTTALTFLIWSLSGQSWLVYATVFAAILPDIWWFWLFLFFETKYKKFRVGKITGLHSRIQWCEQPWGLFIEIPVAVVLIKIVFDLM